MSKPNVDWWRYRDAIDLYCKIYPEDNLSKGHLAIADLLGEMAGHLEAVLKLSPDCKRCAHLIARAKEIGGTPTEKE